MEPPQAQGPRSLLPPRSGHSLTVALLRGVREEQDKEYDRVSHLPGDTLPCPA